MEHWAGWWHCLVADSRRTKKKWYYNICKTKKKPNGITYFHLFRVINILGTCTTTIIYTVDLRSTTKIDCSGTTYPLNILQWRKPSHLQWRKEVSELSNSPEISSIKANSTPTHQPPNCQKWPYNRSEINMLQIRNQYVTNQKLV